MNIKGKIKRQYIYFRVGLKVFNYYFENFFPVFTLKWFTFVGWLLMLSGLHYVSLNVDSVLIDALFGISYFSLFLFLGVGFFKTIDSVIKNPALRGLITLIFLFFSFKILIPSLENTVEQLSMGNKESTTSSFEPQVYFARVVQVGGVGSDIYTNRAYYFCDGDGVKQDCWPEYLDKDIYARVSFNTPFYLVYLWCKDDYTATTVSDNSFSAAEDANDNSLGFGTLIEENEMRSDITIKCQKL